MELTEETESTEIVSFKKKTRKNIRQRTNDDDVEETKEDRDLSEKVELYKELRKLRERPHGVSVVALALGKKSEPEDDTLTNTDPFKSSTGGMIDMAALNSGKYQAKDDAYETGVGTQFAVETNARDEDAEMLKYIEGKLQEYKRAHATVKKQGDPNARPGDDGPSFKFLSPEEAALQAVPEHLRKSGSSNRSEEMLSNQMLSGIPEVDLGIEVKIKNIEATEEAKQKILRDRLNKKEGPSHFVPTNMAVNFVQHNRFNLDDSRGAAARKRPVVKEPEKPKKVVVVGAEPEEVGSMGPGEKKEKGEKATDDFHFEKFKKQFRRF